MGARHQEQENGCDYQTEKSMAIPEDMRAKLSDYLA